MRVDVRVVLRCRRCEMTCNVDRALDAYFSLNEILDVYRMKGCSHPFNMVEIKISQINLHQELLLPDGKPLDETECVQVFRQKSSAAR